MAFVTRFIIVVAVLAAAAACSTNLERNVQINGDLVSPDDLDTLDRLNGAPVMDGSYWLNGGTGEWGPEGEPAQGVLGRPDDVADFCASHGSC